MRNTAIGISLILFILCIPTAIIHPLIPFGMLLLLYVILEIYLNKHVREPRLYFKGMGITLIFLIPASCGVAVLEGGIFAGGPFYGATYVGNLKILTPSDSIHYKAGYLISYKRNENTAPVLAYIVDQNARWASKIETDSEGLYQVNEIISLEVHPGFLRDRINFLMVLPKIVLPF